MRRIYKPRRISTLPVATDRPLMSETASPRSPPCWTSAGVTDDIKAIRAPSGRAGTTFSSGAVTMLTHPIPPIGADLKARVKATPPYRVSIGVAGAISVTDDPESEKIRGAEITVVPK
jgi:hypothetical protein